ncbi:MAG: hypothetical protein IT210_09170 [Armatimonadetes bacterium]|nr:hypothetical protein [Armatimonadota bacterium]
MKVGSPVVGAARTTGPKSRTSIRAILVGLAFVAYFRAGGPGGVGGYHLAPGALVVVFLMAVGVNPLLRRMRRRPFSAGELLVIWAMLAVALTDNIWVYLPLSLAGPFYYAKPANQWATLIHPYLPPWLFPRRPETIRWFFEGIPQGQMIPWADWAAALTPWFVFAALFYMMMFCVTTLLRRQWTDREHFSFPIVQIPVEVAAAGENRSGSLLALPIFWTGMSVPLGLHLLNGLAMHIPAVPSLRLVIPLDPLFHNRPWTELQPMSLYIVFAVIGFGFLLPLEISFSFAFFYLFYKVECYFGGVWGLEMPWAQGYISREFCQNQEIGASIALFGGILYAARLHLKEAWRAALRPKSPEDAGEPMRYRSAFLGLAFSLAGMGVWLWAAGVAPLMAALFLLLSVLVGVVCAWAVTGGGQFFLQNTFAPLEVMNKGLGSLAVGARSQTMLRITQMIFVFDVRAQAMPTLLHGYKAADAGGVARSYMLRAMTLSAFVTLIFGLAQQVWYVNHYSGLKLGTWLYLDAPQLPSQQIAAALLNPVCPGLGAFFTMAGGALLTVFLLAMRARHLWFPLHPIGFAFAGSYAMYTVWFSFLLGWFCKLLVTRYGGMKGFLLLRPFFIGMILGDGLVASFWSIVGVITRVGYPAFSGIS